MRDYKGYLHAKHLNNVGNHQKALQIYRSLYNEEPENDLINYGIAYSLLNIYKDLQNNLEIENQIRNHIKKAQKKGIELLGQLEEKLGNLGLAKRYYEKDIKLGNNVNSFYYLILLNQKLGNIEEANECYDMFLKKVENIPENIIKDDKYTLFILGKSAMEQDDYEVSRKIFNYLKNFRNYRQTAVICLIRLDTKTRNYEEAYKKTSLLKDNNNLEEGPLYLFILHKLNYLYKEYPTNHRYIKKQLLKYSQERTILHIMKKHKDEFLDFVDPSLMFHTCNKNIKDLNPIKRYGDFDKYYIDFTSDIGEVKGNLTNRVCVVTIADTTKILEIRPVSVLEKEKKYDYISESENSNQKVKRKSQIEKFNSRYNLQ